MMQDQILSTAGDTLMDVKGTSNQALTERKFLASCRALYIENFSCTKDEVFREVMCEKRRDDENLELS
jgi:hypothetical protein